ncbi:glutamate-1-semialdehyde 2,1-aminomutase [Enhydrobacter aerosaccus]|uniref:Glutamate-1-semialdehyde 2,1-aminomutase n=1 Tax=Enhydrobacter aerosaccus TaxID=225324 RepID=A0A1T4MRX9_9HYPH|nr:aminotransferase class III-fold pyridoxal phosphate-dependent enzyme [Enhydrobacter aerosaccus]SJZ69661.1 glutamate-1-semialdehyde 2,1-aminomutase [Enhydrobacter aerosaccus]
MSITLPNASLDDTLSEAHARYERANPRSQAVHLEACNAMPGGNTRTTLFHGPFPLALESGQGGRVRDVDGHAYIDMIGEYSAALYGHSHPAIRAAVEAALARGLNLGGHGIAEARLAQLVCARFPSIELVRFTNSGTEANLMAVATAKAATGRKRVMVMNGGYHGGLMYFGGGGSPVNAPHDYLLGRYNDVEGTVALIEAHGPELACILVEPMLGAGGCIPATPAFLGAVREAASRVGAVLIFDEVMTSRMSAGGRQAMLGIAPDMTTLGKYIGGGMSFGAFGGNRDLMALYDPRRPDALPHGGTFNNNVLSMAAGYAGLSEAFTPAAADALFARGEALRARLNAAANAAGITAQWTGLGSMACVHFGIAGPIASPADLAAADKTALELFFLDMLHRGFYLARRGMIALNLMVSEEECTAFVDAWQDFLAERRPVLPG